MELCVAFMPLVVYTRTIKPPLGTPPSMLLHPLISEDQQDKMHQVFHLGKQLTLKTFAIGSSTKCNPVVLPLMIGTPSLDPSRLHEITHLESLTMCLTHRIAREPVKPP